MLHRTVLQLGVSPPHAQFVTWDQAKAVGWSSGDDILGRLELVHILVTVLVDLQPLQDERQPQSPAADVMG